MDNCCNKTVCGSMQWNRCKRKTTNFIFPSFTFFRFFFSYYHFRSNGIMSNLFVRVSFIYSRVRFHFVVYYLTNTFLKLFSGWKGKMILFDIARGARIFAYFYGGKFSIILNVLTSDHNELPPEVKTKKKPIAKWSSPVGL